MTPPVTSPQDAGTCEPPPTFSAPVVGYDTSMTDNSELRHEEDNEAVQAVVDRVLSWQEGAPAETVREELEKGLSEIGETRSEEWLQDHAERISKADPAQS